MQCLKCLHEFANRCSWRLACPHCQMVDLLKSQINGAPGSEMEAVLGHLRAEDDIRNKPLKGAKEHVSEEGGETEWKNK